EIMQIEAKNKYIAYQGDLYSKFKDTLTQIENIVAEIDFLVSGAEIAKKYGYVKPVINQDDPGYSYINAKDLRHPIVERVNTEEKYISNDIILDNNKTGLVITGINGVGKSSYLKSIGLNIVLAQIGYFVPC